MWFLLFGELFGFTEILGTAINTFQTIALFTTYSLGRMFAAMLVSLVLALSYGIAAAKYKRAQKVMIPLLDILQSVPILGFFPVAIFLLIAILGETGLGVEVAAIFLIVTSMAWNMIFAVYESMLTLPREVNEVSSAFNLRGWRKFRRVFFPATIPKLVFNMILSWSNGWYFLVAAEIISVGTQSYTLPGLGSFLATSTYSGDFAGAFFGIIVLILIIFATDLLIWRPIEALSARYKFDPAPIELATPSGIFNVSRISGRLVRFPIPKGTSPLIHWIRHIITGTLQFMSRVIDELHSKVIGGRYWIFKDIGRGVGLLFLALILYSLFTIVFTGRQNIFQSISGLLTDPNLMEKVYQIPISTISSLGRLGVALLISLAWTSVVAVKIARGGRRFAVAMPIFQTAAAIPPTAFFPFIVVLFIDIPGGLELAAILLTITGMQWYLLFNLIAGVRSIPSDVNEVARSVKLQGIGYWKKVLLPSMYPSLVTGSITAWGGGWNALILAEFVIVGGKTFSVLGLGALINIAAYEIGDVSLLLLIVFSMVVTIVVIDRFFWRRLYAKVEEWSKT